MGIELLKQAGLQLDKESRKELAYFLIDSLLDEQGEPPLSKEHMDEVEKRLELFEKGKLESESSEVVLERIRDKYGI